MYPTASTTKTDKHFSKDVITDVCFKSVRKPSNTTIKHWLDYSFSYSFFHNYLFGLAKPTKISLIVETDERIPDF